MIFLHRTYSIVHIIFLLGIMTPSFRSFSDVIPTSLQPKLQLDIRLKKTTFVEFEPIDAERIIKNISNEDVIVWSCGFWCNDDVIVKNSTGQEVKRTRQGIQAKKQVENRNRDKNAKGSLPPGETNLLQFDVTDLFILSPGTYTLQGWYDGIPSRIVSFTILTKEQLKQTETKSLQDMISLCPQTSPQKEACQAVAYLAVEEIKFNGQSFLKYWPWTKEVDICTFSGITCNKNRMSIKVDFHIKPGLLLEFAKRWPSSIPINIEGNHLSCLDFLSKKPTQEIKNKKIICSFNDSF